MRDKKRNMENKKELESVIETQRKGEKEKKWEIARAPSPPGEKHGASSIPW